MTQTKKRNSLYIFGGLMLVAFTSFAYVQFNDSLTPYVSFEQATASPRTVQVAGGLEQNSSSYDVEEGYLRFSLVDTEDPSKTMPVRYDGVKPANFEDAISIVAIGRWNEADEEFAAHNLLVKCPSKYQGLEEYETKSYGPDSGPDGDYSDALHPEPATAPST